MTPRRAVRAAAVHALTESLNQILRILSSAVATSCDVAVVTPLAGPWWKRMLRIGSSYWCCFVCRGRAERTSYTATSPLSVPVARHMPISSNCNDDICGVTTTQGHGADALTSNISSSGSRSGSRSDGAAVHRYKTATYRGL